MPGTKNNQTSSFRIGRGSLKGRVIKFGHAPDLRPTLTRVREAVFSMLHEYAASHGFLDAFAGSGIMATEAASVGFQPIVCCETHRPSLDQIADNFQKLQISARTVAKSALTAAEDLTPGAWIIYADPPFAQANLHVPFLEKLGALSAIHPGSIYVAESELPPPATVPQPWSTWKTRRYGRIHLWLGIKEANAAGPE